MGLAIGLCSLGASGAGAGVVLYQIVKQQGRMMLRIEELERALAGAMGGHAHEAVGLPVGSALAPMTLTDLDGHEVTLGDFEGRKLMVVNWNPTCGYCDLIGPDLARLGPELTRANAALVLLAHGGAEANRALAEKHGLSDQVLLLEEGASPPAFHGVGTPAAFLVDEHSRVASPVAVGADKVPLLAEQAAAATNGRRPKKLRGQRDLSESSLVRNGLKAGTPAPPFTLPDVSGTSVALADYRGRRVLLTFSAPDCGPCDALAPHLVEAHERDSGTDPSIVLVGRGAVEDNRKKAEDHGYRFPVVVQDGWKLSKDYGIFETPVAFLIDEQGTIARNVARGVDEIVALLADVRS